MRALVFKGILPAFGGLALLAAFILSIASYWPAASSYSSFHGIGGIFLIGAGCCWPRAAMLVTGPLPAFFTTGTLPALAARRPRRSPPQTVRRPPPAGQSRAGRPCRPA